MKGYRQYFRLIVILCTHITKCHLWPFWPPLKIHAIFTIYGLKRMHTECLSWTMILMDGLKTQGHYNQPNQSQFSLQGYTKKQHNLLSWFLIIQELFLSQEHTNDPKVCLKGKILSFTINTKSVVQCTNSFFLKGHADCYRRDLLSSLNQNGITPFKMPVTELFAHSTPSLRVYV